MLQKIKNVIDEVLAPLREKQVKRIRFKPSNRRMGKVTYQVVVNNYVFMYDKLSDARHLKRLLKKGAPQAEPVIIRTDTTEEGYIVDEREIK